MPEVSSRKKDKKEEIDINSIFTNEVTHCIQPNPSKQLNQVSLEFLTFSLQLLKHNLSIVTQLVSPHIYPCY